MKTQQEAANMAAAITGNEQATVSIIEPINLKNSIDRIVAPFGELYFVKLSGEIQNDVALYYKGKEIHRATGNVSTGDMLILCDEVDGIGSNEDLIISGFNYKA